MMHNGMLYNPALLTLCITLHDSKKKKKEKWNQFIIKLIQDYPSHKKKKKQKHLPLKNIIWQAPVRPVPFLLNHVH